MSVRKSRRYTDEERAAARARQREQVEASVRALLTSEGWRQWAQTRATFHRYSLGNCLLIAMQDPAATQVAGFKAWQQLGRRVRKGERAIRIMAPIVIGGGKDDRKALREGAMQVTSADKMPDESARMLFRAVPVFDIAQTDGEPLPQPPREPITGDSHAGYLEPLRAFARSMGVTVEEGSTGAAQGFYEDRGKRIVVSPDLPPNGQVRTLVHELAHAVGVPSYETHGQAAAEVIVETAGTIVCGSMGLDTSGEAIPYIAGWGEAGDLDAIRKYAETVDRIARTLEEACEAMAVKLESEANAAV